jgi:ABC-type uncharacterized transport system
VEVKPQKGGLTRGARLSIFLNVVVICALATLLAFAVIWLVGRLSWKHDLRVDLTRDARFTVDPFAEKVVRGLKEPVRATFVYGIDDEIRGRALDLAKRPREDILTTYYRPVLLKAAARVQVILGEWAKLSENFTVDTIDADMTPHLLAEVAARQGKTARDLVRGINQVVFEMGPRTRRVPMGRMFVIDWGFFPPDPRAPANPPRMSAAWNVQSELTETLRALSAGESLNIGIPTGIASAIPPETADFAALQDFLSSQGFDPLPFDLAAGVPPEASLVAFLGMGRKLRADEALALKRYEEAGGRMLLLADPRKPEAFPGVLDNYGVRLEAAMIEDQARQDPRQTDRTVLLSDELCAGNHEIDRPLLRRIGIALGPCRPLAIENLGTAGAERIALLQGSPGAVAVPVEYREQTGEPEPIWTARKSAPNATLAAALRRPAGGKESRIVVAGSWELADPGRLMLGTHFGNRDFFLNSLNWIADRHALIGIVEREIGATRVELSPSFLNSYLWINLGALNAVLIVVAVLVWLKRRN